MYSRGTQLAIQRGRKKKGKRRVRFCRGSEILPINRDEGSMQKEGKSILQSPSVIRPSVVVLPGLFVTIVRSLSACLP